MAKLPNLRRHEILFEAFCCVMVADGKASASEKKRVVQLMTDAGCPWTSEETYSRISQFVSRVRTEGIRSVLNRTCDEVKLLSGTDTSSVLQDCLKVAGSDSLKHANETNTIQRIRRALEQPTSPHEVSSGYKWARLLIPLISSYAGLHFALHVLHVRHIYWRADKLLIVVGGLLGCLVGAIAGAFLIHWDVYGEIILFRLGVRQAQTKIHKQRVHRRLVRRISPSLFPWLLGGASFTLAYLGMQWPLLESCVCGFVLFFVCFSVELVFSERVVTDVFELVVLKRFESTRKERVHESNRFVVRHGSEYITDAGFICWTDHDTMMMKAGARYLASGRSKWTATGFQCNAEILNVLEENVDCDGILEPTFQTIVEKREERH
jgi:uncharacterized tellurite resistance protein B-like protein